MASREDEQLEIIPVPCLKTNYAYVLRIRGGNTTQRDCGAVVVDPSAFTPVHEVLQREGLTLEAIWLTHHHRDHVGGVEELCDFYHPREVVASTYDIQKKRVPSATRAVKDQDRWTFSNFEVCAWALPGHTLGALTYLVDGHAFTGDTLFLAGCGKVYEGTMSQMKQSLERFRSLPPNTQVWCGHEYTVKNLTFAQSLEPTNPAIREALHQAKDRREKGLTTVPGTLATELRVNPFLRCAEEALRQSMGGGAVSGCASSSELETFTALRHAKDLF